VFYLTRKGQIVVDYVVFDFARFDYQIIIWLYKVMSANVRG
jgi:hypothetical protein